MGVIYIQRCDDKAINIYDKYKIDVRGVETLKNEEEVELGKNTALYNTIIRVAIHPNQMNLLSNFTSYISGRLRGQYDKASRGESKDGVFQLADIENNKGYRLSYVTIKDTGKKDGKWKLLDLLFLNELPQATLVVGENLCIGSTPCDIYLSNGQFNKGVKKRYVINEDEWAMVIPANGKTYANGIPVFGEAGYVRDSQKIEHIDDSVILKCEIAHKGQQYPIVSYDKGESWFMLKPLIQNIANRKEVVLKYPTKDPVMYYAKDILPELELPSDFELLEAKDLASLCEQLEQTGRWDDFYNKKSLYGFVEYLSLNTQTPRSAFWCKNRKGGTTGFQFIRKGTLIVAEFIHVEDYTYLPIIGICKNA